MGIVPSVVLFIRAMLADRIAVAGEHLALRHQLGVLQRSVKRPKHLGKAISGCVEHRKRVLFREGTARALRKDC